MLDKNEHKDIVKYLGGEREMLAVLGAILDKMFEKHPYIMLSTPKRNYMINKTKDNAVIIPMKSREIEEIVKDLEENNEEDLFKTNM